MQVFLSKLSRRVSKYQTVFHRACEHFRSPLYVHQRRFPSSSSLFTFRRFSLRQTFQLTPQCSSMLLKCRFHDREWNCSELFTFRKTQDGFCCTFNYATKGDDTQLWVSRRPLRSLGQLFILFILRRESFHLFLTAEVSTDRVQASFRVSSRFQPVAVLFSRCLEIIKDTHK